MAKVVITFAADLKRVGKTEDVPDDEAVVMVREGRATYATKKDAESAAKATNTVVPSALPAS
jgi:glucose/arabinose dehydrogenase